MKTHFLSFLLLSLISLAAFTSLPERPIASTSADEAQVSAAILDYVEGVYLADTSRIYRSVHPSLVKRGSWVDERTGQYVPLQEMNFQQLVQLTKNWNKSGQQANASSPRKIEIYDILDKTATAKVTAVWGTDYFHLAKLDNSWYIMNVLWQSPPPRK